MLPYIQLPSLELGPVAIHPFGVLVVIAIAVGVYLARWRARRLGLDAARLDSLLNWMLPCGFVGMHVFELIFYRPGELIARPWSLFFLWEGLSSFGGFLGAVLGVLLWRRLRGRGEPLLPLADVILSVFPVAWIFGRAGCAVAHDHPGLPAPASSWLAVAFPGGPRYDLGLLEMLFAVALSGVLLLLWRRRLPVGSYVALVSLAYAPVRFGLDFLRLPEGDARYAGLTPAQWACLALFGFGLAMLYRLRAAPRVPGLAGPAAERAAAPGDADDPGAREPAPERPGASLLRGR
jgi:phosphatidylglycerol---prolipoprotein diacylglyceryl transferase